MEVSCADLDLAREAWTDARAASVPVVDWDRLLWEFGADLGKKCWGKCKREAYLNSYRIYLSRRLMATSRNSILNTIIHELVHTVAYNHGRIFRLYANKINSVFPDKYHVSRFTSEAEKGMSKEESIAMHRYALVCPCCGKLYTFDRLAKSVRHPERFYCSVCFKAAGKKNFLKRVK